MTVIKILIACACFAVLQALPAAACFGQNAVEQGVVAPQPSTQPATAPAKVEENEEDDFGERVDASKMIAQADASGRAVNVSGGRRGDGDPDLVLAAVAPVQVAYTRFAQPMLFWHLSKDTDRPIVLSISREGEPIPKWRVTRQGARQGYQRISLRDAGVTLEPDAVYEWVVAVVEDEQFRSKDLVVTGFVRRTNVPASLGASPDANERADVLAAAGLTHDWLGMLAGQARRAQSDPAQAAYFAELSRVLQISEVSPRNIRGQ